jgi:drug/metabolite transporter (DMT)-like permease
MMGQLIALLMVANGKVSEILEKNKAFVTPFTLISIYYFFLFLLWLLVNKRLKLPKLSYLLIVALDTQANFAMVYAFSIIPANFIFIVNIQMVFWTTLLSMIFIKVYTYRWYHILGSLIAIGGGCLSLYGCLNAIKDSDDFLIHMKGVYYSLGASVGFSM